MAYEAAYRGGQPKLQSSNVKFRLAYRLSPRLGRFTRLTGDARAPHACKGDVHELMVAVRHD